MTETPDLPFGPPPRRRKAPPDPKPDLPPAAQKSADLDALKKTVEDAASVSGGLWLSYLFALFYIAVAAGAVTHADLFLQRPVKLPFLGIELPLTAFFALAPILFLITHAYTLVHFVLLAAKAKRFHVELKAQVKDANAPDAAALRDGLRGQLPSNIFVQFLAGPREHREGWFGRFLALMALTTLVIAPIALLLLLQMQFLPYHDSSITWTHRIALVLDLALIWWLWRKILAGQTEIEETRSWSLETKALSRNMSAMAFVFSWFLATFPGEWENQPFAWFASVTPPALNQLRASATDGLFNGEVDEISRRRATRFSNTLVLQGFSLYDALKIDDPKKVEWRDLFDARGRDLKGVVFDGAILPRTDFSGAHLQGASFAGAQLNGAKFDSANLQGANLDQTLLQGASLDGARLQGASLSEAQLQGASLDFARLQGATLGFARLQGAWLANAELQGASFAKAELQGAQLRGAQLQGARLVGAQLQGAKLDGAVMKATNLSDAFVWRAWFPNWASNLSVHGTRWRPETQVRDDVSPWTNARYDALRQRIEQIVPAGDHRTEALANIRSLDCDVAGLSSCDAAAPEQASVAAARRMIEQASVNDATYKKALVGEFGELICGGDGDAVYILRGLLRSKSIKAAGVEASTLVARIMSKNCPVSVALTDDDIASLRTVAKEAVPPPPQELTPTPQPPRRKK